MSTLGMVLSMIMSQSTALRTQLYMALQCVDNSRIHSFQHYHAWKAAGLYSSLVHPKSVYGQAIAVIVICLYCMKHHAQQCAKLAMPKLTSSLHQSACLGRTAHALQQRTALPAACYMACNSHQWSTHVSLGHKHRHIILWKVCWTLLLHEVDDLRLHIRNRTLTVHCHSIAIQLLNRLTTV